MSGVKHKTSSSLATLIGDVVASRRSTDRPALHHAINRALEQGVDDAVDPPALTVGDEFQGSYSTVGAAISAALSIRLALSGVDDSPVDVRFGIGWGEVTVLDERIQDGPGWWSAREAIEWTAATQRQAALATLRTAYRSSTPDGPDVQAVNAALICRDQLLGSLDARSLRLLRGLLEGKTKKDLAELEGISASAVSQRAARDGLDALVLAADQLRGVR